MYLLTFPISDPAYPSSSHRKSVYSLLSTLAASYFPTSPFPSFLKIVATLGNIMPEHISMEINDGCDTDLSLGVIYGVRALSNPSNNPAKEPSLTLSLSESSTEAAKAVEKATARQASLSSPHSTVSSFSTANMTKKKKLNAGGGEEAEVERGSSLPSDHDEAEAGGVRKKLKLTKEQSALLEHTFKEHTTLNSNQKQAMAKKLNLRPRQIEVWFQNRKARTKLKQTELNYELLKRCCETLTEENRRLQKELKVLKATSLPLPLFMQLPATTNALCPSCERIIGASGAGAGTIKKEAAAAVTPSLPRHLFNRFKGSAAC